MDEVRSLKIGNHIQKSSKKYPCLIYFATAMLKQWFTPSSCT
jgi:hypothetical protein